MFNVFFKKSRNNSLNSKLLGNAIISVGIKALGIIFGLITTVILARALGVEEYGVYTYVLAVVNLLAVPAMFGLPTLIVRETARAEVNEDWGLMRGLWSWSNKITIMLAIIITLITALALWFNRENYSLIQFYTFAWGLLFIPLTSLAALRGASLRGLRKVIQGQLPEQVLKPFLFIISLVVVGLYSTKASAVDAMMLNTFSAALAFVFGAWLLSREKPKQFRTVSNKYNKKAWIKSVIPLAMVNGLDVALQYMAIIMLGILATDSDVGLYRASLQGALLLVIGTEAIKAVTAPHIARYFQVGDNESLKKLIVRNTRLGFSFAFLMLVFFLFFGKWLLVTIFGSDFENSYTTLIILCFGQLVHTAIGIVGSILNMSGLEKLTIKSQVVSIFFNVAMNFLLIPIYGVEGAALSTVISITIRKFLLWHAAYKELNIDTSIFGIQVVRR